MASLAQTILSPAAYLFQAATSLRSYCYEKSWFRAYNSTLPVICVGNITVGGSGKSPVVQYLCSELRARGKKPVILLRGYGGLERGPYLLRPESTVWQVGDEALMHFQAFHGEIPIVVSASRVAGAKFIEANQLADTIVLDDGFQHLALARDLNILLLDASSEESIRRWWKGAVLPSGVLRESLQSAIARTDAVFFVSKNASNDVSKHPALSSPLFGTIARFHFVLQPSTICDPASGAVFPLETLQKKQLGILTAIAAPQSFIDTACHLGAEIVHSDIYPDHHFFSEAEFKKALTAAGSTLLVTTKDAVKLTAFAKLPGQMLVLKQSGEFLDQQSKADFFERCEQLLHTAKNRVTHLPRSN